jgi:hypothetical protein
MKQVCPGPGKPPKKGGQVGGMKVATRAVMDFCLVELGPELCRFSITTGIGIGYEGSHCFPISIHTQDVSDKGAGGNPSDLIFNRTWCR